MTLTRDIFEGKTILITGGTGSYGTAMVRHLLGTGAYKIIVFSRDELKQHEMAGKFSDSRLRYFIGDVRDKDRLLRAFHHVDIVIHAAAMKQVGACNYNPTEAIATNIIGTSNVINACLDRGVKTCLFLSSDKACAPANLYGKSKACAEELILAANSYSGAGGTRFGAMRYGNVAASRGSVIPLWRNLPSLTPTPVTDLRMTRFWFDLKGATEFTASVLAAMELRLGTLFVPVLKSFSMEDLANAMRPQHLIKVTGARPGEKLSEVMIARDEASSFAYEGWALVKDGVGERLPEGRDYDSAGGIRLSVDELRALLKEIP